MVRVIGLAAPAPSSRTKCAGHCATPYVYPILLVRLGFGTGEGRHLSHSFQPSNRTILNPPRFLES